MNCTIYTSELSESEVNQLSEELKTVGVDLNVPATLAFDPSGAIQVVFSFIESIGPDVAATLVGAMLEKAIEHIVDYFKVKNKSTDSQDSLQFFSIEYDEHHAQLATNMSMSPEEQAVAILLVVNKLLGDSKD